MICTCCGLTITEKKHKVTQGFICDRCWNDPNLFFPEKITSTNRGQELLDLFDVTKKHENSIHLPVLKLMQKSVTLYTGKLKVKDLINLYGVYSFEEETLQGYQRELYEDQVNELYQYLLDCPVAIMPGIFISIREGVNFNIISFNQDYKNFDQNFQDFGILEIPLRKGAFWIIDGQHRISSFEKFLSNIGQFNLVKATYKDSLFTFLDYEIPVTFVDSKKAIESIYKRNNLSLTPSDIERATFFIINKTQRRLSPSLRDTLQYCIKTSGLKGIPSIEKEAWRTEASSLGINLNSMDESPLFKKINISGLRGLNRPIQLNSFVSSLKPLFKNDTFKILNHEEKIKLLFNYWNIIKKNNLNAFSEMEYRKYLLLKAVGVYTLHLLLVDYIKILNDDIGILDKDNIENFINKINGFNWTKSSSPIAHFGGMSGVREAHKILLNYRNKDDNENNYSDYI